jgi:hypothetical protein
MANNRLYLRCACGERYELALFYPTPPRPTFGFGWVRWSDSHDPEDYLANFLREHSHDLSQWGTQTGPPFSLEFETVVIGDPWPGPEEAGGKLTPKQVESIMGPP